MKLTERKLRNIIREVILEATTTSSTAAVRKSGKTAGHADAQKAYDTAKTKASDARTTYNTNKAVYDKHTTEEPTYRSRGQDLPAKYRKSGRTPGSYEYSNLPFARGGEDNPSYTSWSVLNSKHKTASDGSKTDWDDAAASERDAYSNLGKVKRTATKKRTQSIAQKRASRGGGKAGRGDKRGGRAYAKSAGSKFAKLSGYETVKDKDKK